MTALVPLSLLLFLLSLPAATAAAAAEPTTVNVGVILDLDTHVGRTCHASINLAVSDFYAANPNSTSKLRLHFRDSKRDVVTAASAAVDLLTTAGAAAILGPQTSSSASFIADLGTQSHTPIVSISATSPSLSPSLFPFFVRAALDDAASAAPIADLAKYFGWRRVVPIYEDSDYGAALLPFLVDALDAVGSQVPYRIPISSSASNDRISAELYGLMTLQTRVFVVHATSSLAVRIFENAKEAGMMAEGYAWIVTDGIASLINSIDPSVVSDSMQGVLGVKPYIPRSERLKDFKSRWRREFLKENPDSYVADLCTFGIWAYDAATAVAMAAEAAGPLDSGIHNPPRSRTTNSTDLSSLPMWRTGEKLLELVRSTEFDGLGGRFRLVDGELNATAFRIVNVVGEKGHGIGYWTAKGGLSRRLEKGSGGKGEGLGPVIWPGETTVVPRGWETPTSGNKMRIAVPGPVEPGFHSFLSVDRDSETNETVASGYVIEVFEAAVRRLPYALRFEYVPFQDKNGSSAGDYNTLIRRVPEEYDAVVGDVTITANRSKYVDFTLPFTVSGVSMVVPVNDERNQNAWIFLKPLTLDLWLASGAFFVFTGLVVWALEHRINEEFRGPPDHQIGTVFYFAFSSLVFSHKEAIVSNFAKIVMIIWVFVVLILQSSYTASLTSMLTVRQFKPTVTDYHELINNKEYVGYLKNSFVKGLLLKWGFKEFQLKPYRSPQQYADALAKGSKNDGVSAVVDEVPYLNLFLKDFCDNYTMAGQRFKTGGFGFVFPKGSPLVSDLSKAILSLTESEEMTEIERRWFGDQGGCLSQGSTISASSHSLNFMSFSGLFLITGIASLLCLIIYLVSFVYKNRNFILEIAFKNSFKWRLHSIARLYDQKDLSSHTFRKAELKGRSMGGIRDPTASPSIDNMDSPISFSHHIYGDASPSTELASSRPETPPHAC